MSTITISRGSTDLIITGYDSADGEVLQLRLVETVSGEGEPDDLTWTEKKAELGNIELYLEDVKVLNDIVERWMYAAIDREHHGEDDRPRLG